MPATASPESPARQNPLSTGRDAHAPREATPAQVRQWMQAGECIVIDVREPDEHARERIAGTVLVPLSRFDPDQVAARARPGQTIVMHCKSGGRSSDACRLAASLSESGFRVFTMAGGIEGWKSDALPVQENRRVSRMTVMRQVQLVIGLSVVAGSALAWLVDPAFIGIPAFFGAGLAFAGATGTCALARVISRMPWNRVRGDATTCATGSC